MAHSFQDTVYVVGNPIYIDGRPYGVDSGYADTVIIGGHRYVLLADIARLFGYETDVRNTTSSVRPFGLTTISSNVHQNPAPRRVIPLTSIPQAMTMMRTRLDRIDEAQMEDTTSSEEDPNSDDKDFIESDNESPEKEESESEEEEEAEFTSDSSSESSSESESESEELPGRKRHASSTSQRPSKSAKH